MGKNSRLLLGDGTIYWVGSHDDAVRPTGPFDPELPVLGFRRGDGKFEAILFNHSTHTIGTHKPGRSLAGVLRPGRSSNREGAWRNGHLLRRRIGFDPQPRRPDSRSDAPHRGRGCCGPSTRLAPRPVDRVRSLKKEVTVKVRRFDEAADERAVTAYCTKRIKDPASAERVIATFRAMRKEVAPHQGESRKTWVQAVLIGDIALVGVPGEFFTVLGQEIKRRSPFRYTYVFELANDYIGYIPDQVGFDRGGYQTWTGLHSFLERGTGELIVDEAVGLLDRLHQEPRPRTKP